jgi:uncharacterized membrane protein YsdA (DUF1294 family)
MVAVALAVLLTAGLTLLMVMRLGFATWIAYGIAINATTLLAYTYDKRIAGGDRQRVPERVLHGLALFGGTPAALAGQLVLRHKTRKSSFLGWFWAIVALQVAGVALWLWLRTR